MPYSEVSQHIAPEVRNIRNYSIPDVAHLGPAGGNQEFSFKRLVIKLPLHARPTIPSQHWATGIAAVNRMAAE